MKVDLSKSFLKTLKACNSVLNDVIVRCEVQQANEGSGAPLYLNRDDHFVTNKALAAHLNITESQLKHLKIRFPLHGFFFERERWYRKSDVVLWPGLGELEGVRKRAKFASKGRVLRDLPVTIVRVKSKYSLSVNILMVRYQRRKLTMVMPPWSKDSEGAINDFVRQRINDIHSVEPFKIKPAGYEE